MKKKLIPYQEFGKTEEELVEELERVSNGETSFPYDGIIGKKGEIKIIPALVYPYVSTTLKRDEKTARNVIEKAIDEQPTFVKFDGNLGYLKIVRIGDDWYGNIIEYKWKGESIDGLNNNYFTITRTPKRKLKKWKEFSENLQLNPKIEKIDGVVAICTDTIEFGDSEQLKKYAEEILLPMSKKRGDVLKIIGDSDIEIDKKKINVTLYRSGSDLLPYLVDQIGKKKYVYKEVSKEYPRLSNVKEKLTDLMAIASPGLVGFSIAGLITYSAGLRPVEVLEVGAICGAGLEASIIGGIYVDDKLKERKRKAKENIMKIAKRMPGKCVVVSDTRSATKINPEKIEKINNRC